jgi:hypothetical protein
MSTAVNEQHRQDSRTFPIEVLTPVDITDDKIDAIYGRRGVKQTGKAMSRLKACRRKGEAGRVTMQVRPEHMNAFVQFVQSQGAAVKWPRPARPHRPRKPQGGAQAAFAGHPNRPTHWI